MVELQLGKPYAPECEFVIVDIMTEDKEITMDDTQHELIITIYMYATVDNTG